MLDELATITGFCEPAKSSYWSNEVRSVANEEFTVKTSNGTMEVGLYRNLTDVRSKGAKYAKSIYVSFNENGNWRMGNIKASGAALTAWIEFGKKHQVMGGRCSITGSEKAKKGIYQNPNKEKMMEQNRTAKASTIYDLPLIVK